MKIRISIILMIVLLMMNSTVFSSSYNNVNYMYNFGDDVIKNINSDKLQKIVHIISNTIEINYKNNNSSQDEINKINKILSCNNYDYYEISENEINAKFDSEKVNVIINNNNNLSDVSVTCTKEGIYNTKELNKISKDFCKYKGINNDSFVLSNTIKYEITGNDKLVLQYMNDTLDSINLTEYTQGIFGTGYMQNTKISFAIANYDTGSYLIVGTPIINIAY